MPDSPKDSADGPPPVASRGSGEGTRDGPSGDLDELRDKIYLDAHYITERYCDDGRSIDEFEHRLHTMWYTCYQVAMHLSCSSAEPEKLAFELFQTRGLGRLTRLAQSNDGSFETAELAGGVLWEDLPFFVTDMTDLWVDNCATMSAAQRLNFSYFLARLASTGLDNDGLCRIALVLFRDTFEAVRPLGSLGEPANTTDSPDKDLSIAALLPAACIWMRKACNKIFQLSDASWNNCSVTIGQGGATFTESALGQKSKSSAGFSPWRWLYWLKRLQEISDEATQAGETKLVHHASDAICLMLSVVDTRESLVLRELKAIPDLVKHQDRYSDMTKFIEWLQSLDMYELAKWDVSGLVLSLDDPARLDTA
ncbi:Uncharacterized protein TPAR_00209 [Tolypocladium paradoxum]|uniref:Uncharacterized protein n=1 Tax=Tolypocladium paradoxum TaxID=94208 RepID=A0A2S4LAY7_9HYPO|nr:Uncharacterized protein TPAR_00209 [Tolypocladium paradoxum]